VHGAVFPGIRTSTTSGACGLRQLTELLDHPISSGLTPDVSATIASMLAGFACRPAQRRDESVAIRNLGRGFFAARARVE
jgi:hypothetical protein